ncbi:MAG: hypothetical protein QN163_06745 [Armatimonadota bacterium]|nr:hypothetical protein [Armatimonadota bacterium]MDR5698138.1 hypothetical protein [Armatimonadota bacterium]
MIEDVAAKFAALARRRRGRTFPVGAFVVPLRRAEKLRARTRVLGQDPVRLARHLDVIAPMAYHGAVGRPPSWVVDILEAFAGEVGRPVLPVLQADAPGWETVWEAALSHPRSLGAVAFHYGTLVPDRWKALARRGG